MKIAIITVDYNNHQDTKEFLISAKRLDLANLETLWLVVDNGSDTSIKSIVSNFPQVTWMQTGINSGFTGGFNRGMKYAKEWGADYYLIINNDTLITDKYFVKKLIRIMENNPKIGAVSPKILFAPNFEYYRDKYSKTDSGKVIWYAGGEFDWNNITSVHRGIDEVDTGKYDMIERTGFVSGCCILVKKEVLEKVGYFEEKLFAYYEDADWNIRMRNKGFEVWYAGNTSIYHKVSRTAGIGSEFTDNLSTRNRLWLGMKYAANKTKFALLRQTVKQIIWGRPGQKSGITGYITGKWGWAKSVQNPSPEFPIETSVIIINYKTTDLTIKLIQGLQKQIYRDFEIIVLDNSPDEPCTTQIKKKFPKIKFIANSINNGFSGGNNQMINYSLGKYVLLLNSDIAVKPDSLKKLMDKARQNERAIYAGKLFFPNGEEQDSCFRLPTAWGAFQQYFLNIPGSYFMYRPQNFGVVEGAVMACFLIPRKVINEIGNLQEKTFMYFEDIEYCRRAKMANIPIYFIPDAKFVHYHGQSAKKAGVDLSNQRIVTAAKWYHGKFKYALLYLVLWAGQKWGQVITPKSMWKEGK